jgi:hypothetical protein
MSTSAQFETPYAIFSIAISTAQQSEVGLRHGQMNCHLWRFGKKVFSPNVHQNDVWGIDVKANYNVT